jgi:hypothetical protein
MKSAGRMKALGCPSPKASLPNGLLEGGGIPPGGIPKSPPPGGLSLLLAGIASLNEQFFPSSLQSQKKVLFFAYTVWCPLWHSLTQTEHMPVFPVKPQV